MKTTIVKRRAIAEAPVMRIDASFQLSEGVTVRRIIANSPYPTIKCGDAMERIWHAGRWKRVYVDNPSTGIPLVGSSAMLKSDLSDIKLISKKYTDDMDDKMLYPGWILVSCSGTIGNTVFTNEGHAGKLASQHVLRLKPKDILGAGFTYAYLSSKYGYALLTQGTFGAVIQHIEPANVENIPIPVFPEEMQKEIDGLIRDAASLRDEAAKLLDEAKAVLQKFIGLEYCESSGYKTSSRSVRDIRSSLKLRFDPPVYLNEGVEAMVNLSKRTVSLSHCNAKVRRPGIFKRSYVANGLPYIKGSEIFNTNPFMRCENLSRTKTPMQDEMALKDGQILVTCAGSVGQVKLITKEFENKKAIGSQDIIRIEAADTLYTPEYLFAYLSLPFIYNYMQSMKYGAVIERIEPFHVESIPVITPTKELSEEITSMIKRYKECIYAAFCNEERAISMVETEIESWNQKPKNE